MPGYTLSYETLLGFCKRKDLHVLPNAAQQQIVLLYQILGMDAPLMLITRPEQGMVTVAVTLPFHTVPEHHGRLADALTYLNTAAFMGAWVLDREGCQVAFRVSVPALDTEYSDDGLLFVAQVVATTAATMAERVLRVAEGKAPPESVLVEAAAPEGEAAAAQE